MSIKDMVDDMTNAHLFRKLLRNCAEYARELLELVQRRTLASDVVLTKNYGAKAANAI
jgi:hypothetical protein